MTDAGFRAVVFHPALGRALALMTVRNSVILFSVVGVIRRVQMRSGRVIRSS